MSFPSDEPNGKIDYIFVSKDIDVVKRACAALRDCGISYWVAYENECFGEQYAIA